MNLHVIVSKTCLTVVFIILALSKGSSQPGVAQVNGINIAYHSYGSRNKEAFLLISGTNAQLTMWPKTFCEKLVSKGYRVIVFDNRDIGLSTKFDDAGLPDWNAITKALEIGEKPPLAYSLDDMAKDAVVLLDVLGIKKAHIVGASMGGMIAQRVAYYYPGHALSLTSIMAGGGKPTFPLVARVDLLSTIPAPGPADDTANYIQRELQSMKVLAGNTYPVNETKALALIRSNIRRSYHPDGLVRQGAASVAGFYAGRTADLQSIKIPTLVIHGTEDPLVIIDAGRDVAASVPGARFESIEGMGHDLPEALLDKLAALIIANAERK
ncbi:alpha/beta fold hydrolase [Flavitalea antarctica]